jgi:2-polyprenyl-6-methoxyphenol hydroxylase-like FAD-dependent oxidoreductase
MLLARRGRRVLLVDRAHFPSDTVSTHFMWPRTTAFLAKWGLLDALAATGCPPIDSVTLRFGAVAVQGRPEAVGGSAMMYCPRRTVLDALLIDAARRAGAEVREGMLVRDLVMVNGRVIGVRGQGPDGQAREERAAIVVGADGIFSRVAVATRAEMDRFHPSLACGFYAYWSDAPTTDGGVEFNLRHGRDVLVFPTHDRLTCVWVGRSISEWATYRADIEAGYLTGLDPELRARLQAGRRMTPFKGTSKLPNFYRRCHGAGWALVGDAAYHRDPLTGMGIGDAFLGAELLAEAADAALDGDADALAGYQSALRERTEAVFDYTLQSAALRDPAALSPLYVEISRRPELTQQLMNVLAGSVPFRTLFNARNIARLMADGRKADGALAEGPNQFSPS